MNQEFRISTRVLYGDVDAMNFVYYGNYARWFEAARAEFMRDRGLPYAEVEQRGYFLPVNEAFYKYVKPIRYDDIIWLRAWPDPIRKASIQFNYRIETEDEELLASGYTLHACMNAQGRVTRIPEFLLDALGD